jgi:hypothetical protein
MLPLRPGGPALPLLRKHLCAQLHDLIQHAHCVLQGTYYPPSERDPSKLRAPLLVPAAERREAFPSLNAEVRRDQ